jgi:redox-sensitive bicupin YhaK (pirin superfamily)
MRRIVLAGLAVLGLVLAVQLPAQASARMQFGEIWYNSPGSDRGGAASLDHEWVQLHNTSGSRITMTGWTLRDAANHVFRFPAFTIKPHAYVKIHTGPGGNTQTDLYWNKNWYIWNNTGDTAILRDSSGHQLDKCTYTGTSQGFVFC